LVLNLRLLTGVVCDEGFGLVVGWRDGAGGRALWVIASVLLRLEGIYRVFFSVSLRDLRGFYITVS
jgi:hypothetical protein